MRCARSGVRGVDEFARATWAAHHLDYERAVSRFSSKQGSLFQALVARRAVALGIRPLTAVESADVVDIVFAALSDCADDGAAAAGSAGRLKPIGDEEVAGADLIERG